MSGSEETERSPSLMRELAHELRDALSPLASSVDLARLRNFDPEVGQLLAQKVERGLRRSLAILETFVLAEQAECGTLALQVQAVPLEEIVQRGRAALGATERLELAGADDGAVVRADAGLSARVVTAVLQHAAALAATDRPLEVQRVASRIRVRVPIDPHNLPGESWFASHRGGDGRMALRTARQIMRLQGGSLELLKDPPGAFEIILQFQGEAHLATPGRDAPAPSAAPARSQAERAAGGRVLIVDDSAEVRRSYSEALAELGYTVLEAADAEQALGSLETTRPDAALIDIHLPRMNGFRLARAIRARAGKGIFLVMLSGLSLDAVTRELAREAGFDDSLDKMAGPIALRELLEAGRARQRQS